MSHLPFTLSAYLLNSISVTTNKFLLNKAIPDPFVYIFYVSIFSLIILPGVFMTSAPSPQIFILASVSTLLWTLGAYFMFWALKVGQVSRVIPVIGTLIPLFLLFSAAGSSAISNTQTQAVIILILGLVLLTIFDWKGLPAGRAGKFNKSEVLFEVISAILFAISYVVLRQAYLGENFLTVLVWSRVIIVPVILLTFLIPALRLRVTPKKEGPKTHMFSKSGMLFLASQASGGASELLLTFSISLANPALVNSLQGVQYVFLLTFGLFLGEKYSKLQLLIKILGIILIGAGLYLLAFSD